MYAFPDFAGLSWCAAALVSHWFRLSLVLWEPWLRREFKNAGIIINTDFEAVADLVASGGFVQLRGATWYVKADKTNLYRQDTRSIIALPRTDLTHEEAKEVALVEEGQCRCPVCISLTCLEMLSTDFEAFSAHQNQAILCSTFLGGLCLSDG